MNTINLSKEAKSLVEECDVRPGVAAVWYEALKRHFQYYGADRIMTEKKDFDRIFLDIYLDKILQHYDGKLIKKEFDKVWKQSKTNYEYFLKSIFFVSKAIDITQK
jgi:hypothetical protein